MNRSNVKKAFSIVIPIFNAKRFISSHLNLLIQQVSEEFEIILVNDGSTDGSDVICNQFREDYPDLVRVHHQENSGAFFARLSGVNIAEGNYICFIDADDYWNMDSASIIKETISAHTADVFLFGYREIDESTNHEELRVPSFEPGLYTSESCKEIRSNILENDYQNMLWTKVIRKELFDSTFSQKIPLKNFSYAEDFYQVLLIVDSANSFYVSHDKIYDYIKNPSSTTSKGMTNQSLESLVFVYTEYLKFVKLWNFPLERAKKRLVVPINHALYALLYGHQQPGPLLEVVFSNNFFKLCKSASKIEMKLYYRIACFFILHDMKKILRSYIFFFSKINRMRLKIKKVRA